MYRTISQKMVSLPASNQAVKQKVFITKNIDLTPQESEQLSRYVADDSYVKRQKQDIQELTSMFRDLMGSSEKDTGEEEYIDDSKSILHRSPDLKRFIRFWWKGKESPLLLRLTGRSTIFIMEMPTILM